MTLYRSIKTTPMQYHNIFKMFSAFIATGGFSRAYILISITNQFTWNIALDVFHCFLSGIILAIAFIGLHKLNIWGWLSTMTYCFHLSLYSIYSLVYGIAQAIAFEDVVPHFGLLVLAIFTACYYYPRRPLFLVGITMNRWAKNTSSPFHSFLSYRCPICCHKFNPTDTFCGKCGAFVWKRQ